MLFQLECRFLYFLYFFILFYTFYTFIFLTSDLFLSATPKQWKKPIGLRGPELYAESSAKKKSNTQEARQTLKIIGVAI